MASITPTNKRWSTFGDKQIMFVDAASVADTNTFVPEGFDIIDMVLVTPRTSGTPAYASPQWSGTTITFDMSATADVTICVIGS